MAPVLDQAASAKEQQKASDMDEHQVASAQAPAQQQVASAKEQQSGEVLTLDQEVVSPQDQQRCPVWILFNITNVGTVCSNE